MHIFDFDKQIYGQKVEIFFEDFIRPEKKFDSAYRAILFLLFEIDKNYLKELCKIAQENQILVCIDEAQTGFGRMAKLFPYLLIPNCSMIYL